MTWTFIRGSVLASATTFCDMKKDVGMLIRILRWSWAVVCLLATPQLLFATPIASEDVAAALSDPLEVSARVDAAVTERSSAAIATVDAISSPSGAPIVVVPVTHVTSLVPECDTFDGDPVAPSCAFVSWFSDEGVGAADVSADEPLDRSAPGDIPVARSSGGSGFSATALLGLLGVGLVGGSFVVRWRVRRRHHRRRTGVRAPKVFARAD